jgi:hypothetical protein
MKPDNDDAGLSIAWAGCQFKHTLGDACGCCLIAPSVVGLGLIAGAEPGEAGIRPLAMPADGVVSPHWKAGTPMAMQSRVPSSVYGNTAIETLGSSEWPMFPSARPGGTTKTGALAVERPTDNPCWPWFSPSRAGSSASKPGRLVRPDHQPPDLVLQFFSALFLCLYPFVHLPF